MAAASQMHIEVVMRQDGSSVPLPAAIKRDGKYYQIEDVKRIVTESDRRGGSREKYLVNINGYDKYIFHERSGWYILNESEDKRIFTDPE